MEYLSLAFDPESGLPLYRQLYARLAAGIASGQIRAGEKLPSKRRLAAELGVSLNTVESALAMLADEGYLELRERSGAYVADISPLLPPLHPAAPQPAEPASPARWEISFSTGDVDPALFPYKTWTRITREVLGGGAEVLNRGPAAGDLLLRGAIADYLGAFRGVHCTPEQVLVGAGMETLLGLLAPLLPARVGIEDPGYAKARRIFLNAGLAVCGIPVGRDGLSVGALGQSGAGAVYVTPSHQFPTGALMPFGGRSALLQWASDAPGRLIVEDDYDSEFRFDGRPIPSLQSLDRRGQVVYVGTFSRSIAPGIRIAYIVLPDPLLARWQKRYGGYSCTVSRMEQRVLARFLTDGVFTRSLNRARGHYRQRRDALAAALRSEFGAGCSLWGSHTGLHFLFCPGNGLSEQELVRRADRAGIRLAGLSEYGTPPSFLPGAAVVLGYGTLEPGRAAPAAARLRRAWQ